MDHGERFWRGYVVRIMPSDFKYTRKAIELTNPGLVPDDEDLSAGFSLLRELSADPTNGIEKLGPGVYYVSKLDNPYPDPGE